MNYAYGLVDKNNIIRTVEDIICAGDDSSHQTINDFKEEVNTKIESVYSKDETRKEIDETIENFYNEVIYPTYAPRTSVYTQIETINHIESAIKDFEYLTGATLETKINEAKQECNDFAIGAITGEIDKLFNDQLPDFYYDQDATKDVIDEKIYQFESDQLVPNYATKQQVINTRNDILNEVNTLYYTRNHIDQNYYTAQQHSEEITNLTNKIFNLEQRILSLESKHSDN